MITYTLRSSIAPIVIQECWYGPEEIGKHTDVVRFFNWKEPPACARTEEFTTIYIDLSQDEEALLRAMQKTTRYEIKKAAGDGLRYDFWFEDAAAHIDEFREFYDEFAESKQIPRAEQSWLEAHAETQTLDLSRISDAAGKPVV